MSYSFTLAEVAGSNMNSTTDACIKGHCDLASIGAGAASSQQKGIAHKPPHRPR
jgi:hypothetical protein